MLQSSNHYLRPDYLTATNTLDTKSSPLALLAQTCSAIGADTANSKLLAANIEKSARAHKNSLDGRDKSSPVSSHSSSVSTGSVEQQPIQKNTCFKPYETNNNRIDLEQLEQQATNLSQSQSNQQQQQSQSRVKSPASKQQNGQQQRCDSNQSATSQRDSSPAVSSSNTQSTTTPTTNGSRRRTPNNSILDMQRQSPHNSKDSPLGSTASPAGMATTPTTRLQAASDAAYAAAAKEASYVKALQAAAAAAGVPTSSASSAAAAAAAYYSSGYPGGSGSTSGMPYPMDLMTASAMMSPHHPMFKAALMNPYLNYARLKGLDSAAAAAMLTPNICRDPYCTGCPSSPHFLNKAAGQPCPAGCPQCEQQGNKSNSGSSSGSHSHSSSAAAAAAVAASSYHAQLAALAAASQLPYVCSWIGADTAYCGKRFGTSDELFQHLRTHTASVPDAVLNAAAAGGIPPNHPLFQRTYPTPPLSPMSAARYHPYGKPTMLPPTLGPPGSLASLGMSTHPALAQYFSPYALYGGPRMGSSHP